MDSHLFDKRVVRRNIEKGLITQQEYIAYLEGLKDIEAKCEPVEESLYGKDEEEAKPEPETDDSALSES